jgi:hypothetical protein
MSLRSLPLRLTSHHHTRTLTTTARRQWDMAGLTPSSLNPALLKVEYAVRGELAIKAEAYRVQLQEHGSKEAGLPFDRVISSNIGNPQQKGLDQPPLTFPRQVRLPPFLFKPIG